VIYATIFFHEENTHYKVQRNAVLRRILPLENARQDKEGAALSLGAYIDVRDQDKTQARRRIAPHFIGKKEKRFAVDFGQTSSFRC